MGMSDAQALDFIALDLPIAPSVNMAFPANKRGRRFKSKGYTVWESHAGFEISQQRPGCINGPVDVSILIKRIKNADVDNRIKITLDLLVKYGLIDGDSSKTLQRVTAAWSDDIPRMRVEIRRAA
jgi:crossover junction endodeoxyribonuclease RusA